VAAKLGKATGSLRTRRDYQWLRDHNLCVHCWKKAVPGMARCEACREKRRRRQALLEKRRMANGLCRMCGRPVEKGFKMHARSECVPSRRSR